MPVQQVCELPECAPGDILHVPIDVLCAEARAQEANFVRGEPSDDAAGVELFRRAIADADEAAWEAVVALYRGLLIAQSARQVVRSLVVEDAGFCVDRAFQRFWRATRTRGIHEFQDLASILKYLKMCLASVLLDEARARRRQACVSLDDLAPDVYVSTDPSAEVVANIAQVDLWKAIDRELRNDTERLVVRLSFAAGLSPREITALHPARFPDVFEVYRLKRNLIERLRRSPAIGDLLN
jgi:DNA-directed RNA polymerase specialized sigma24 family protein